MTALVPLNVLILMIITNMTVFKFGYKALYQAECECDDFQCIITERNIYCGLVYNSNFLPLSIIFKFILQLVK